MAKGGFHESFFTTAWPTAEFGAMGLEGAVKAGFKKELEAVGNAEEREALYDKLLAELCETGRAINMASYFEIDSVIDPAEIEAVLYRHPKILETAVVGIPDEDWGESVKSAIVLRRGETATEEEIIRYCREHLAGYKVPRSVVFAEELPKTDTGKILKKHIKAPYWK